MFRDRRRDYVGSPFLDEYMFDVELVETILSQMKRGKAAGLDELTIEHLDNSHPVLVAILNKFFNLIVSAAYITYTALGLATLYLSPRKNKQSHKGNSVDNYRAISISPIRPISKIFEHCILSRYSKFLVTNSNQFGFKKGSGCNYVIGLYSVRKVGEHFVACGSTVDVCLLDLSKSIR